MKYQVRPPDWYHLGSHEPLTKGCYEPDVSKFKSKPQKDQTDFKSFNFIAEQSLIPLKGI